MTTGFLGVNLPAKRDIINFERKGPPRVLAADIAAILPSPPSAGISFNDATQFRNMSDLR